MIIAGPSLTLRIENFARIMMGVTTRCDEAVVFAADERGFNLKAFVNYGDKASIGGSGPCTEKSA